MHSISLGHPDPRSKLELEAQSLGDIGRLLPEKPQSSTLHYTAVSPQLTDPSAMEAAASPINPPFRAWGW
jgi:hypothetical protein